MKLELGFAGLVAARTRMGAPEHDWVSDGRELEPRASIDFELSTGLEIDIRQVESEGILHSYKGRHVVLYIKDHTRIHGWSDGPKQRRKVHLADCRTIVEKKRDGSFDRYVATTRRDNLYAIDYSDNVTSRVKERDIDLWPCQNCLTLLGYEGFATQHADRPRMQIVEGFDINAFFEDYVASFSSRPRYTDRNAPRAGYVNTWSLISHRLRKGRNWKCERCGVNLAHHRAALHTHHVNGVTRDNSLRNLKSLCALCHKAQPGHAGMPVDASIRSAIASARKAQGVRRPRRD